MDITIIALLLFALAIIGMIFNSLLSKEYFGAIHYLSSHKSIARFFAHGGIHLIVLFLCSLLLFVMLRALFRNNVASFNQLVYTFYGDTLKNYKLNYLSLEKDMSRRPGETFNKDDIVLAYGYERDTAVHNPKILRPPFQNKRIIDDYDLVSVVRYLTVNSIKDTLEKNPSKKYLINKNNQVIHTEKISNHDRYYYSYSRLTDVKHIFYRVTNAKDRLIDWNEMNPYFSFWIGIVMMDEVNLNDRSIIKIKYNKVEKENAQNGIERPLVLDKIMPEPTSKSMTEIVYRGKELDEVIRQRGIYISGEDPLKKSSAEKMNVFYTVLAGTIIAFILDIIVNLVIKWRKLEE